MIANDLQNYLHLKMDSIEDSNLRMKKPLKTFFGRVVKMPL
nr:hypothetical protein [Chryseobacterium rhizoplanae]